MTDRGGFGPGLDDGMAIATQFDGELLGQLLTHNRHDYPRWRAGSP